MPAHKLSKIQNKPAVRALMVPAQKFTASDQTECLQLAEDLTQFAADIRKIPIGDNAKKVYALDEASALDYTSNALKLTCELSAYNVDATGKLAHGGYGPEKYGASSAQSLLDKITALTTTKNSALASLNIAKSVRSNTPKTHVFGPAYAAAEAALAKKYINYAKEVSNNQGATLFASLKPSSCASVRQISLSSNSAVERAKSFRRIMSGLDDSNVQQTHRLMIASLMASIQNEIMVLNCARYDHLRSPKNARETVTFNPTSDSKGLSVMAMQQLNLIYETLAAGLNFSTLDATSVGKFADSLMKVLDAVSKSDKASLQRVSLPSTITPATLLNDLNQAVGYTDPLKLQAIADFTTQARKNNLLNSATLEDARTYILNTPLTDDPAQQAAFQEKLAQIARGEGLAVVSNLFDDPDACITVQLLKEDIAKFSQGVKDTALRLKEMHSLSEVPPLPLLAIETVNPANIDGDGCLLASFKTDTQAIYDSITAYVEAVSDLYVGNYDYATDVKAVADITATTPDFLSTFVSCDCLQTAALSDICSLDICFDRVKRFNDGLFDNIMNRYVGKRLAFPNPSVNDPLFTLLTTNIGSITDNPTDAEKTNYIAQTSAYATLVAVAATGEPTVEVTDSSRLDAIGDVLEYFTNVSSELTSADIRAFLSYYVDDLLGSAGFYNPDNKVQFSNYLNNAVDYHIYQIDNTHTLGADITPENIQGVVDFIAKLELFKIDLSTDNHCTNVTTTAIDFCIAQNYVHSTLAAEDDDLGAAPGAFTDKFLEFAKEADYTCAVAGVDCGISSNTIEAQIGIYKAQSTVSKASQIALADRFVAALTPNYDTTDSASCTFTSGPDTIVAVTHGFCAKIEGFAGLVIREKIFDIVERSLKAVDLDKDITKTGEERYKTHAALRDIAGYADFLDMTVEWEDVTDKTTLTDALTFMEHMTSIVFDVFNLPSLRPGKTNPIGPIIDLIAQSSELKTVLTAIDFDPVLANQLNHMKEFLKKAPVGQRDFHIVEGLIDKRFDNLKGWDTMKADSAVMTEFSRMINDFDFAAYHDDTKENRECRGGHFDTYLCIALRMLDGRIETDMRSDIGKNPLAQNTSAAQDMSTWMQAAGISSTLTDALDVFAAHSTLRLTSDAEALGDAFYEVLSGQPVATRISYWDYTNSPSEVNDITLPYPIYNIRPEQKKLSELVQAGGLSSDNFFNLYSNTVYQTMVWMGVDPSDPAAGHIGTLLEDMSNNSFAGLYTEAEAQANIAYYQRLEALQDDDRVSSCGGDRSTRLLCLTLRIVIGNELESWEDKVGLSPNLSSQLEAFYTAIADTSKFDLSVLAKETIKTNIRNYLDSSIVTVDVQRELASTLAEAMLGGGHMAAFWDDTEDFPSNNQNIWPGFVLHL